MRESPMVIHSWPVTILVCIGAGWIGGAAVALFSSPTSEQVLAAGCGILLGAVLLLAAWELAQ